MLGSHYRVWVQNETLVAANVSISVKGRKFDSNGALEFESGSPEIYSNPSLSTGSGSAGTTRDNTGGTAKWLEGDMSIMVTTTGSPGGKLSVLLQRSVTGTDWPTDNTGELLFSINITASGTETRVVPFS